ncbi:hypothetical protein [Desulfotalea psychrophila]|uniref:Uncharacterized protein n=1 Tax=Desulfotalea psychrophila (strain LSv54 / DSM 12343) TaxID=177439 RepID=Q6AS63_DESPS|nr:hypothetical protein [Desulfotalea psychrophila]CAG34812.1 unknown protein [Desulfotalea psychrophila LSv54]
MDRFENMISKRRITKQNKKEILEVKRKARIFFSLQEVAFCAETAYTSFASLSFEKARKMIYISGSM